MPRPRWNLEDRDFARLLRASAVKGGLAYGHAVESLTDRDSVAVTLTYWLPKDDFVKVVTRRDADFLAGCNAFCNLMAAVAAAMTWRCSLRKAHGHAPYTGSTPQSGEMWTRQEVAEASWLYHESHTLCWVRATNGRESPFRDPRAQRARKLTVDLKQLVEGWATWEQKRCASGLPCAICEAGMSHHVNDLSPPPAPPTCETNGHPYLDGTCMVCGKVAYSWPHNGES